MNKEMESLDSEEKTILWKGIIVGDWVELSCLWDIIGKGKVIWRNDNTVILFSDDNEKIAIPLLIVKDVEVIERSILLMDKINDDIVIARNKGDLDDLGWEFLKPFHDKKDPNRNAVIYQNDDRYALLDYFEIEEPWLPDQVLFDRFIEWSDIAFTFVDYIDE